MYSITEGFYPVPSSGNPFKCHGDVLFLRPMIPPNRFDIFPPLTKGCSEVLHVFRFYLSVFSARWIGFPSRGYTTICWEIQVAAVYSLKHTGNDDIILRSVWYNSYFFAVFNTCLWYTVIPNIYSNPAVNTPRPSSGTRIESCDFIVLIGDP